MIVSGKTLLFYICCGLLNLKPLLLPLEVFKFLIPINNCYRSYPLKANACAKQRKLDSFDNSLLNNDKTLINEKSMIDWNIDDRKNLS